MVTATKEMPTPKTPQLDERKFRELALYIAQKCADSPYFGMVKWNKVLFYCDFLAYGILGKPITGATYTKQPLGPGAMPLKLVSEQLRKKGELGMEPRPWRDEVQERPVALREPDLTVFSGPEVALVDEVIKATFDASGNFLSWVSHTDRGWSLALPGEPIPYYSVFLRSKPWTPEEIVHAREVIAAHGGRTTAAA